LTAEEEKMLKGYRGPAVALAMKLLVALGDVFEAKKMIKIGSAQISGISYKNIGDPGLRFIEDLSKMDAKAKVRSSLNPAGMDLKKWREMGINEIFAKNQLRIINAFDKMKIETTCTCAPYLIGNRPMIGEHVAWAESSAVVFANSVLGARTNREGGPSALASALTGLTPLYGYHLDDERKPTHIIRVEADVGDELRFSTLGYAVGKMLGQGVPFFEDLGRPSQEEFKALGAGLAASGSVGIYHIANITPESRLITHKDISRCEKITVENRDLREILSRLSVEDDFNFVCIGCPHCSLSEIKRAAGMLSGKKVRKRFWIFTSRRIHKEAVKRGFSKAIEKAGGRIIDDTCMVVSPLDEIRINGVVVNSCKAAHYIPSTCRLKVNLRNFEECIKAAIK
jgi:predicted aconitase